jgi:hypothetical protein
MQRRWFVFGALAGKFIADAFAAPQKRRNSEMEIKRSGSQPSGKGPAEYFAGTVRVDPLFK